MTVPANAKKPEDHKQPATAKQDVDPIRTVEFHGHEYTVDTSAMDDIDVMEALTDAKTTGDDSNFMVAFVLMLRGLLGAEYARWKTEQKDIHDRVGAELMQEFIEAAGGGNS